MNRNFVAFVALTAIGIVPGIPGYARDQPAQPPAAGAATGPPCEDVFNAAIDLHEAGKYTKAIAKYTQCIVMRKTFSDAYLNRGICYTEIGELEKALADFEFYISRKPERGDGYLERSYVYRKKKLYRKALDEIKVGESKNLSQRDRLFIAYHRAGVYLDMGDYEKAITDYSEYINQRIRLGWGTDAQAYQCRGNAYMLKYRALEKRGATAESWQAYEDAQRDFAEYERLKPKTTPWL